MYYTLLFWIITLTATITSFNSTQYLTAEDEKPLSHLANTELGLSVVVNNCVNIITGDFVESSTDLTVVGPEPLTFQRFYSSGDYKTRCLYQGWRYNLNNYIKINTDHPSSGGRESLIADYVESSGRSAVYYTKFPKHGNKMTAVFDLDFCGKGFTNSGSGIISARTNPKNISITYDKKEKKVDVTSASGSKFKYVHHKEFPNTYPLLSEQKLNGHILEYIYDKKQKHCSQVNLWDSAKTNHFSWIQILERGEVKTSARPSREFHIKASDGRSVRYVLLKEGDDRFYISEVHRPDAPTVKYEYKKVNRDDDAEYIVKKVLPENRFLNIEYYNKKELDCSSSDFRVDRVKQLLAPIGNDAKPLVTHRFVYHSFEKDSHYERIKSGFTEVFDANNNKTIYRYSTQHRLQCIERYLGKKLYQRDNFGWGPEDEQAGYLKNTCLQDGDENIVCGRVFQYDEFGNIIAEKFYGNISGISPPIIWKGKPINNGCDCYTKNYTYNKQHLMISQSEDNGKGVLYSYHGESDLLGSKFITSNGKIYIRNFYDYDEFGVVIKTITDNGTTADKSDLTGVTERKIVLVFPRLTAPVGVPERVDEVYVDVSSSSGQEHLIKRTLNAFSVEGNLLKQDHYDSDGALRYTLTWEYDPHGNVIRETNALGEVIERRYDANDNLTFEKGPSNSHHKEYVYDYSNRLICDRDVLSDGTVLTTSHKYDLVGNKVATIDACGQETQYSYDALGRVIRILYPAIPDEQGNLVQAATSKQYDVMGHVTQVTDQRLDNISTVNNVYGKPVIITYPDNTTESFVYNLDGTLKQSVAKNGVITLHTYDCLGRLLKKEVYSPDMKLLSQTSSTYDAFHMTSTTDAEGNVTSYRYDGAGRLIEVAQGDRLTTHEYDRLGRMHKIREWYGHGTHDCRITIKHHDLLNRVVEESIEDGNSSSGQAALRLVRYTFDSDGNVVCQSQEAQAGTANTYTEYNGSKKPFKIIDPLGNVTRITYDYKAVNQYGQLVMQITRTDPLGNQIVTTHNALGQVGCLVKKNPMGKVIAKKDFFYSGIGDCQMAIETVITPDGSDRKITTRWVHDALHKVRDLIEAEGTLEQKHTCYRYNGYGQKEAIIRPDGVEVLHTYDSLGRLQTFYGSDGSFSYRYNYDKNDNPICVVDNVYQTTTRRVYDHANRIISETFGTCESEFGWSGSGGSGSGLINRYNYDRLGRPVSVVLPDGSGVDYVYDASNLKQVVRKDVSGKTPYKHCYGGYDLSGRVTQMTLAGGCGNLAYKYDLLGRVVEVISLKRSETIKYDAVGNLVNKSIKDDVNDAAAVSCDCDFAYDDLYQLKSESGVVAHKYKCDSVYNCVNKDGEARHFNALNQLLKKGDTVYSYDSNGNLLTEVCKGDVKQYAYDALDRLVSVSTADMEVSYVYDAFNRRISKKIVQDGYETKYTYLYEGQNEVGACLEGKIVELRLLGAGKGAEIGTAIALELGGKVVVPLHDHNGNVVMLLDGTTGEVVERYHYSAFGEEKIFDCNGVDVVDSVVGNPWRFSSKRVDAETGFVYFGRRYYDPSTSRWVTPDPLGFEAGPNLYAYVMNNPLTHIDLYGLIGMPASERPGPGFFHNLQYHPRFVMTEIMKAPGRFIDAIGRHIFAPIPVVGDTLRLAGMTCAGEARQWQPTYKDQHSCKVEAGERNLREDVRYIQVNGIMTTLQEFKDVLVEMSKSLMGQVIHGVYNATHGLTSDLGESVAGKAGFSTNPASKLVERIRSCFSEMSQNGIINLVGFSQGGIIIEEALRQLNEGERSRINVLTFGSAKIIDPKELGLASAVNYISWRDPVPFVTCPIDTFKGWYNKSDHVKFLDSKAIPFCDHRFMSDTYQRELDREIRIWNKL